MFHGIKGLFSGVFHSFSLYSTRVCPILGNIFLLPPSLLYLLSCTQNLMAEKNTNKSIVLVTLGFLNLRVWTQNIGLIYLEVLIRVGQWSDWTMSWDTQVFSICLLCSTQCQLPPETVFSVVWATCTNHQALCFFIHIHREACEWGQEREEEKNAFPRHWIKAFSLSDCKSYAVYIWSCPTWKTVLRLNSWTNGW